MSKVHPADEKTAQNRRILTEVGGKLRRTDTFLLVFLSLFLLVFGVLVYTLPKQDFSAEENRSLQTLPAFSAQALVNGTWQEQIRDFYSDQFPLRRTFLMLHSSTELALLRQESDDVLLCRDGYLVKRLEYTEADYAAIEKNLADLSAFFEKMKQTDRTTTLCVAPRAIDVLTDYLPPAYDTARAEAAWRNVYACAESLNPVLPTALLRSAANTDATGLAGTDRVWYRTDHHYTTYGAYLTYTLLAERLGITPAPLSDFTPALATDSFLGTTAAAANLPLVRSDSIYLYRFAGDDAYLTEIVDTGRQFSGFYEWEALAPHDPYAVFLGGNSGHVRVTLPGEERPTLLVIKDSFAHSAVPFLARHFNLEIVDTRYFRGSVTKLAEECGATGVLALIGLDSLTGEGMLARLSFGS